MKKRLMRFILSFATGTLLLAQGAAFAEKAPEAPEFTYRYWLAKLDGQLGPVTGAGGAVTADSIDLKQSLGIKDQNISDGELRFGINSNTSVKLGYLNTTLSGTGTPDTTIAGIPFAPGVSYHTNAKLQSIDAALVRNLSHEDDEVKTTFQIGIRSMKIEATSTPAVAALPTEHKNFDVVFPTIGFGIEGDTASSIRPFAEIAGAYAGSKGHFYDASVGVKSYYGKNNNTALTAGYRILDMEAKPHSDKLKAKLSGMFFSASFRF